MISNLLLLAIHTKSKWQIHETCINHCYVLTKNRLFTVRHTKQMIQKLESAGLGFFVKATETEERIGE